MNKISLNHDQNDWDGPPWSTWLKKILHDFHNQFMNQNFFFSGTKVVFYFSLVELVGFFSCSIGKNCFRLVWLINYFNQL